MMRRITTQGRAGLVAAAVAVIVVLGGQAAFTTPAAHADQGLTADDREWIEYVTQVMGRRMIDSGIHPWDAARVAEAMRQCLERELPAQDYRMTAHLSCYADSGILAESNSWIEIYTQVAGIDWVRGGRGSREVEQLIVLVRRCIVRRSAEITPVPNDVTAEDRDQILHGCMAEVTAPASRASTTASNQPSASSAGASRPAAQPAPAARTCTMTGTWNTTSGTMRLTEDTSATVRGTHAVNGKSGEFSGRRTGGRLIATWTHTNPRAWGDVDVTLSADCNSFSGRINTLGGSWRSISGTRGR